jgi:N-methylhydantoinase A/oxoprolinase/acetone carboxylase beta subunit
MPKAPPPIRIGLDLGEHGLRALVLRPDGELRSAQLVRQPGESLGGLCSEALGQLGPLGRRSSHSGGVVGRAAPLELVLASRRPWLALHRGVRVALLVTAGFEDLPQLIDRAAEASGLRPSPLLAQPLAVLCPPERCLGVAERLGADGAIVEPLTAAGLSALVAAVAALDVAAVAVVLLHSYQNDAHERTVAAALAPLGLPVSLSSVIARFPDERLRTTATILDAAFAATVGQDSAAAVGASGGRLLRIEATGCAVPATYSLPLRSGLSSVSAGLVGARHLLSSSGLSRFVAIAVDPELSVVALCDPLLRAAASPRLSALGEPAVELALLPGHSPQEHPDSAAVAQLAAAVRAITIDRGHDPADYPLVCYGSGAPTIVTELAAQLAIAPESLTLLPAPAWVAAFGALCAPLVCEQSELLLVEASSAQQTGQVAATLHALSSRLRSELRREGLVASDYLPGQQWRAELRYRGQRQTLSLAGQGDGGPAVSGASDLVVRFCAEHQRRYGFALAECPVELFSLQSRAVIPVAMPAAAALSAMD